MSNSKNAQTRQISTNGGNSRKLYVIRHESDDWTPIVAVISGPKSPALSTMRKRFEALYHKPATPRKPITDGGEMLTHIAATVRYESNLDAMGYAGNCVAEYFVDWLLKTDDKFQRVDYQEVSL